MSDSGRGNLAMTRTIEQRRADAIKSLTAKAERHLLRLKDLQGGFWAFGSDRKSSA
jgi:hypothetical protein